MSRAVVGLRLCALLAAAILSPGCLFGPEEDSRAEEDLDRNRALWASQQIRSYEVEYHVGCFCPPPYHLRLHVRDGVLVSAVAVEDGRPVDAAQLQWLHTVDRAFQVIADALKEGADEVRVSYHPTLGHPVSVYIDHSFNWADEETIFEMRDLLPLR